MICDFFNHPSTLSKRSLSSSSHPPFSQTARSLFEDTHNHLRVGTELSNRIIASRDVVRIAVSLALR
jgi:hypothetical protein